MKRNTLAVFTIFMSAIAFSTPTFAADPCKVLICMYGKATSDSGGSECKSAEKSFFNIVKKKKKGRFDAGKTFDARKSFLDSCPNADPKDISVVMKKFGRSKSGF